MPRISIITVVRNAAAELDATLTNVAAVPDAEIIVIDGASTDNTPEVVKKHRVDYFVSEADSGLYDAMNKGLLAATGDYVWFVNAGDKVHTLPHLGNADIYFGETLITKPDGTPLGLRSKKLPEKLTWKSLERGMVVCHQSFIVRREIAPPYDLQYRYVSDIDWVIKCLKRARSVENSHATLSEFAEGGISTRQRKASLRERWTVMRKHYGLFTTMIAHIQFVLEKPFTKHYRSQ